MSPLATGATRIAGYSVYAIGLIIALAGLANVMPTYDVLARIGPFPVEWFRLLFYWLSILVFLAGEAERRARDGRLSPLHLAAFAIAFAAVTYVCYDYWRIGQIIANSVMFFGPREMYVALIAAGLSLWACWILWGAPIAILGGLALLYLATGQYWPGPLRTAPSDIYDPISANIWYDSDQGIPGSIMGVVLTTVLPFIILGAILEGCGAGGSMIRISFHLMKKFKGGPAYAAILASALFGTVSGSAVAIAIVGIVVSTLSATGVPTSFAVLLSTASGNSLLIALLIAAMGCIILGMGMPTLPAHIAIISVMGPTLQGFGMDLLAAHMFVFFFSVAAGITPPVALTAFAAASVSGGRPIATAVASTRIGAMMFLIPFAWAFDDALLLGIGETDLAVVIPAIFFLLAALYICTSALIGYDRGKLTLVERLGRLGVTIALLTLMLFAELGGLAVGLALVAWRYTLPPTTKETSA